MKNLSDDVLAHIFPLCFYALDRNVEKRSSGPGNVELRASSGRDAHPNELQKIVNSVQQARSRLENQAAGGIIVISLCAEAAPRRLHPFLNSNHVF